MRHKFELRGGKKYERRGCRIARRDTGSEKREKILQVTETLDQVLVCPLLPLPLREKVLEIGSR